MSPTFVFTLRVGQAAEQTAANAARAAQNADQARANADQARANADQARADADRIINDAIQEAERAVNANNAGDAAPPATERPSGFRIEKDGSPVTVDFKDGTIILTQDGFTRDIPLRDAIPREAVQIAWAIPATLSVLLIWWPLSRAVIRWLNRKNVANGETAALEARLRDRLDLLERNVDTVAVEMERLSEGQRFTNKLLADRAEQGERVPLNVPR